MWQMSGFSRIVAEDELLGVLRQPEVLGQGVNLVNGKPVRDPAAAQNFQLRCNVQPLTGPDLLLLPEGDRFNDQMWLWTNEPQNIDVGDLVTRQGLTYQVQESQPWGTYTRARIVLVDNLPASPAPQGP